MLGVNNQQYKINVEKVQSKLIGRLEGQTTLPCRSQHLIN